MSYITNGYNTPRIARQPSLNMYDDIRAGSKALSAFGKKYVVPAAKYAGKEALKLTTKPLPSIGTGIGLTAGTLASVAAGNPELLPYLGSAGGLAGREAGKYVQKKINRAIDAL
jgi:hypothetical protein